MCRFPITCDEFVRALKYLKVHLDFCARNQLNEGSEQCYRHISGLSPPLHHIASTSVAHIRIVRDCLIGCKLRFNAKPF
ncbi:hypothetical protein BDQ94DRAFT_143555 [Aspergillus welwitschiae]|uniref:Uncharacterized protein n=1 Tax=Aspergillus welwitschiae TaxID=1341132 RepID=A0A3F3Q3S1_9EURO|nr:hypothetical protein BDQ94DRAFT_143555 [Aspergillus welwitschiae]RDH33677.1 hypothetical protein BDQ94DRAFT_143555 [Aspergillus welwitschiae]